MIFSEKSYYCFSLLSLIHIILSVYYGINLFVFFVYFYVILFLGVYKKNLEQFLLYSLFIPNKYIQLLSFFIYSLLFFIPCKRVSCSRSNYIFIFFIIVSGFFNCFIHDGLFWGLIFQIGFYFCVLSIIYSPIVNMDKTNLITFMDKMFYLQVAACILEFLFNFQFGDSLTGTLISAHYLGLFLVVYLFIAFRGAKKQFIYKRGLKVSIAIILLVLVDAKHVCLIFIFSFLIYRFFSYFNFKKHLIIIFSSVVFFLVALPYIGNNSCFQNIIYKSIFYPYIYNPVYNKKYEYICRVDEYITQFNGFIGYGVGQFGSQVSISLSKGIIFEWDDSLVGYKKAIQPFYDSIKGIMTKNYVEYGIPSSSMVLGYPLVSFIAILAEIGILGFILFMFILDRRFQLSDKTLLITFFFMCLFDTYLEIPCCFIMVLLGSNLTKTVKFNLN